MRDLRRPVSILAVLLVLSTALVGCGFVGARPASVASIPSFFVGIWDGLIAPWTLLLRAFLDIRMYAVPNSGWWYDAGFLLGITGSIPLGWIAALIAIAQHVFECMSPPIWLDATGRPRPTQACWTCGREAALMRCRAGDLRPHGWRPLETSLAA